MAITQKEMIERTKTHGPVFVQGPTYRVALALVKKGEGVFTPTTHGGKRGIYAALPKGHAQFAAIINAETQAVQAEEESQVCP